MWVSVTVRAGERESTRRMWLPCLDHANRPINGPNAFQVNTTRMRLLTKCLAMFGLGHHIYAGEDVPRPEHDAPPVGEKRDTRAVTAALDGIKVDQNRVSEYVAGIQSAVFNEDPHGLAELLDELKDDADLKLGVWQKLYSKERAYIKKFEQERRNAA